jgi:hypothetical protein
MAVQDQLRGWFQMSDPPKLTTRQQNITGLLGVILLVAAILQAISFGDFRDWLDSIGLGAPVAWAVGLIIAEIWAAIGLFKLPLMNGFKAISAWLAILVAGFWFIQNLRLVSEGASSQLTNSGFFGRFLAQSPGWWTVIEVSIVLFWMVYSLKLTTNWSKY